MPLYEYHCRKCGQDFELMRRVAQMDAAAKCPHCASRATRRKLSVFARVVTAASNRDRDDAADTDLDMGYEHTHDHGGHGHDHDDEDDEDF